MTRRSWLTATLAAAGAPLLRADAADDAWETVGYIASALSRAEPQDALGYFDKAMPGWERLRTDLIALARDFHVETAIDLVGNEGSARARVIEADWLLRFTRAAAREEVARPVTRRARATVKLEKRGRGWKVVSLDPRDLFAPPGV